MSAPQAPPTPPAAPPKPWPGPAPGSYRMGYVGPGVAFWHTQGDPKTRRPRWEQRLVGDSTTTSTSKVVQIRLAWYGRPDGSHIAPSQARLAADLGLSAGTVSRAITEGEDAGWVTVRRSKGHQDADGRLIREPNHYTLCIPPDDALARGIKGTRRRRPSSPSCMRAYMHDRETPSMHLCMHAQMAPQLGPVATCSRVSSSIHHCSARGCHTYSHGIHDSPD